RDALAGRRAAPLQEGRVRARAADRGGGGARGDPRVEERHAEGHAEDPPRKDRGTLRRAHLRGGDGAEGSGRVDPARARGRLRPDVDVGLTITSSGGVGCRRSSGYEVGRSWIHEGIRPWRPRSRSTPACGAAPPCRRARRRERTRRWSSVTGTPTGSWVRACCGPWST